MKVYWCPKTRATRALWLLEEAGLPYERVFVDVRDQQAKSDPAFRAASPMGKVPAIADGEVRLAESAAICLYVADRYPESRLAPAIDAPERGRFLYWMFFTPAVIEPALAEKLGGWQANPGQHGWGDFDSMIKTWEAGLEHGPWLLGERFSAADIMAGSTAVFMRMFGALPDSHVLGSYADRCLARPAYQKALAADEEVQL